LAFPGRAGAGDDKTSRFAGKDSWNAAQRREANHAPEDGNLPYGDLQATAWLAGLISPALTGAMQDISRLGSRGVVMALVAITTLGLLLRKRWQDAVFLLLAYGGGELTVTCLKAYFQRPRPAASLTLVHGYSFPSGHAFNIMLICGFATYLLWPVCRGPWTRGLTLAVSLSLVVLVGFSRISLRAHWLDDVLAGYAVGLAWLLISKRLTAAISPPREPARPGP
jgi:membrane-associated phospholipid phosphatase